MKYYKNEPKAKRITVSALGPAPIKSDLHGQDAVNFMLKHWSEQFNGVLPDKPDLIVVPEACDRFSGHTSEQSKAYFKFREDKILSFFRDTAKKNRCHIVYSSIRFMDDGTFRNSSHLIGRDGKVVGIYNKNYPTSYEISIAGRDAPVFETDFGRVTMVICFDLNFDELLKKHAAFCPDLIIFSSLYHGGIMQNYWAYQSRAHFVGAFAGGECTVINPIGEKIAHSTNYFHRVSCTVNLDCKVIHLDENWGKIQACREKYGPGITMFDPGHLGAVLLTSEMADISIEDIIKEFKIETWDEYHDRSKKHRYILGNMEF